MSSAPIYNIDLQAFWHDPYTDLKQMRADTPIAYVPQLGATLFTRRDDIFENEKKIDIFSSDQPDGLMTQLMGQNMMRKDGEAHMTERKAIFPAVSPKTVKTVWKNKFIHSMQQILDEIEPLGQADIMKDISTRISGEALRHITGLTNMTWQKMDRCSQGMIDGCANYAGVPEIEKRCNDCTKALDNYIHEMTHQVKQTPDHSMLSAQIQAGLPLEQCQANIKLAISGGQNEPRDAIAGTIWALLNNPAQLQLIRDGKHEWKDAFEEYARWMSPIGMSPRRVAKEHLIGEIHLEPEDRVFFMFGSANRDETMFNRPDEFDITQDCSKSIAFGAGPHFCAGAWASRCLISDVALPMIFERLKDLHLIGETKFGGWAFRGPLSMPVAWKS